MSQQKQREVILLSLLFKLFDEVINVLKSFGYAAGLSPLLFVCRTASETTLIECKCFYTTFTKLSENMVVTINVLTKAMDEKKVRDWRD